MSLQTENKKLRILMVNHLSWQRNLGAVRVQIELAEELRKRGHTVEKFSHEDVFGNKYPWFWGRGDFFGKSQEFILKHIHDFDVIDTYQINVSHPQIKKVFPGVIISRSAGLMQLYEDVYREFKVGEEVWTPKGIFAQIVQLPFVRRLRASIKQSILSSDGVFVPNPEEEEYIRQNMCENVTVKVLPFGLSAERFNAFKLSAASAAQRVSAKEIVFVGLWAKRKGSDDWPDIMKGVLARIPDVKFKFLGTGLSKEQILKTNDFSGVKFESWEVIPQFKSEDLPVLLGTSCVGAFPSYVEGFGFAVLEKLASGIPTVSYDISGPSQILAPFKEMCLVPRRDTRAFIQAIVFLCQRSATEYEQISKACLEQAYKFRWDEIAQETEQFYYDRLSTKHTMSGR